MNVSMMFETYDVLKNENLFQKMEYHFLVESTVIENATFPCKTALQLIANVKTNCMGSTKWTYYKKLLLQKTFITKNCQ